MLVKDVSGKELRECHGKSKRMADLIRNSSQKSPTTSSPHESPTKNSPDTPLKNNDVKRPRQEVSNSHPVKKMSKFDTKKENKADVGEITELKKKLVEYEKNMAEITSLKDELIKLKKNLDESSLEKGQLRAREKELMEENSKTKIKLIIEEKAHKVIIDKLNAEIAELKEEISSQYKAGFEKAMKQVVFFASGLNP